VLVYLWADYRPGGQELLEFPRLKYTANSNGQLRHDTLDGTLLPSFPCRDPYRKVSVIVVDVGTGVVSNAGKVTAPCG
jgi:hypothetical protein